MKISEILRKIADTPSPLARDPRLGPDEIKDDKLHTLRRQRAQQLADIEKERLKREITAYNRERDAQMFRHSSILSQRDGFAPRRAPKRPRFL